MGELGNKITRASKSTNVRFKRKKIRSMKREADKIVEKLIKSEAALKLLESRIPKAPSGAPFKLHPLNRNKHIEAKIAEVNKKIRRAKNRRNKERLIAKRNSLRLDLNWGPRLLEGAFDDAYRHYRIDGMEGMDVDTFFARAWKFLIDLRTNSKFVFSGVIGMNINFHRLNLTRGSSYLPLPKWLAKKGTIINPKNSDMECFKWTVIAAMKWIEIVDHPERISKLRRYEDDFDWDGIKFLTSFRDIKRFKSRNEITINILAFERKKVYICRKGKEYDRVANLMLITDRNNKHYVAIKSSRRLLSMQNSKHKESQHVSSIPFRDLRKRNLGMNT